MEHYDIIYHKTKYEEKEGRIAEEVGRQTKHSIWQDYFFTVELSLFGVFFGLKCWLSIVCCGKYCQNVNAYLDLSQELNAITCRHESKKILEQHKAKSLLSPICISLVPNFGNINNYSYSSFLFSMSLSTAFLKMHSSTLRSRSTCHVCCTQE